MKDWIMCEDTEAYKEENGFSNKPDHAETSKKMTFPNSDMPDQEAVLDEILRQTIQDIQAGGRWKTTPEVLEIEKAIHEAYQEVLNASRSIADFRTLCIRWRIAGSR